MQNSSGGKFAQYKSHRFLTEKESLMLQVTLLFSVLHPFLYSPLTPTLQCHFAVPLIRGEKYFSTSLIMDLTMWLALANGLLMDMNQAKS